MNSQEFSLDEMRPQKNASNISMMLQSMQSNSSIRIESRNESKDDDSDTFQQIETLKSELRRTGLTFKKNEVLYESKYVSV